MCREHLHPIVMGNCMETCTQRHEAGEIQGQRQQEEMERCCELVRKEDMRKRGLRVKVLLTKEELKWLIFQLNQREGKKELEQVLQEIDRGRGKMIEEYWKPSLESILEVPEMER